MVRPAKIAPWLLFVLLLGLYWLTARQPALHEDLNVYLIGGEWWDKARDPTMARGFGRFLGNLSSFLLTWDPFGILQPAQALFIGFFGYWGWKSWPSLPPFLRVLVPALLLSGIPYFGHGMIMKSSAPIHALSCVVLALVWRDAWNPSRRLRFVLGLIAACLISEIVFFVIAVWIACEAALRIAARARGKSFSASLPIDGAFPWTVLILMAVLAYRFAFLNQAITHHPRTFALGDALTLLIPAVRTGMKESLVLVKDALPSLLLILGLSSLYPRNNGNPLQLERKRALLLGGVSVLSSVFLASLFLYWLDGGALDWRARFTAATLFILCVGVALPAGTRFLREHRALSVATAFLGACGVFFFFGKTFLWSRADLAAWDRYRAMALARDYSVLKLPYDFGLQDDRFRILYPMRPPNYVVTEYIQKDLGAAPFFHGPRAFPYSPLSTPTPKAGSSLRSQHPEEGH